MQNYAGNLHAADTTCLMFCESSEVARFCGLRGCEILGRQKLRNFRKTEVARFYKQN